MKPLLYIMDIQQRYRLHPLMAAAGVSIILVSMAGVATMTGVLPAPKSAAPSATVAVANPEPSKVAALVPSAAVRTVAAPPVAAVLGLTTPVPTSSEVASVSPPTLGKLAQAAAVPVASASMKQRAAEKPVVVSETLAPGETLVALVPMTEQAQPAKAKAVTRSVAKPASDSDTPPRALASTQKPETRIQPRTEPRADPRSERRAEANGDARIALKRDAPAELQAAQRMARIDERRAVQPAEPVTVTSGNIANGDTASGSGRTAATRVVSPPVTVAAIAPSAAAAPRIIPVYRDSSASTRASAPAPAPAPAPAAAGSTPVSQPEPVIVQPNVRPAAPLYAEIASGEGPNRSQNRLARSPEPYGRAAAYAAPRNENPAVGNDGEGTVLGKVVSNTIDRTIDVLVNILGGGRDAPASGQRVSPTGSTSSEY